MRMLSIPKRAKGINALLQQARRNNLILCSPDGHEFILAEVNGFNHEIELTRKNKRLMTFLAQRARQNRIAPLNKAKKQLGV